MNGGKLGKFCILGVNISAIDMDDTCSLIEEAVSKRQKKYICTCPAGTIMECKRDKRVLESVNSADLAVPDGMAVVWLGKLRGHRQIGRVYGPDLMQKICGISAEKGYRNYLYGSSPDVLDKIRERLGKKYPGLVISGVFSPPFRKLSKDEDDRAVADINRSNSDIVWVGLGSPKQDLWMHEHRDRINASVMIGVGAAFDFLSGTKNQAPKWVQRAGMEWSFRLATEPKRLWRRYIIGNTMFLYLIIKESIENLFKKRKGNNGLLGE